MTSNFMAEPIEFKNSLEAKLPKKDVYRSMLFMYLYNAMCISVELEFLQNTTEKLSDLEEESFANRTIPLLLGNNNIYDVLTQRNKS